MKTKYFVLLIFSTILCGKTVKGQTEFGETPKSKIFIGSTFRLGISNFGSLIELSPYVGYNLNRYFSAGVGPSYTFYSERYLGQSYRTHYYGVRGFIRILPAPERLPGLFLASEIETISNEYFYQDPINFDVIKGRRWTPAYLVGAGFRQKTGNNSYFTVSILYNLADNGSLESTIYGGPLVYRVGFMFGLY
jgi:hypothetical protein